MTHVSRKRIDLNDEKTFSEALNYIFSNLKPSEFNHVLQTLITKTEFKMLYKRLIILLLLDRGMTHKEIAKVVKTTRETVGRLRLQLNEIPFESKSFTLNKITKWSNIDTLKNIVKKSQKLTSNGKS